MKNKILLSAIAVLLIAGTALYINAQSSRGKEVSDADVKKGMETFSQLIAKSNPKDFGLESADELKSLTVGYQFTRNMITLEDVRNYKDGTNPESLIKGSDVTDVLLVNNAGNIITGLEFTKGKEGNVISGYGLTPSYISLKNASSIIGADKLKSGMFVEIPSLHLSFIAVKGDSALNFINLDNADNAGLRIGDIQPASKVLTALVPIAKTYNGLPD